MFKLHVFYHLFILGKLSPRETLFAAAAASFAQGNYLNAAALLESNLMSKNNDIIAMKLAQDSYMLAGDSYNSLGCIARSMHLFDTSSELQGHVMGMFAAGLLEVGRYSDAEEMANKAVTKTKGLDVWALHTLCNAYAMLGRSSEIGSMVNDHINKHKGSTIGLPLLLFNQGCGFIMRGNSNAAVRAHDNIIFNIINDKDSQVAGTLVNATLLLWVISLNSPSLAIDDRWIHVDNVSGLWAGGMQKIEQEIVNNNAESEGHDKVDTASGNLHGIDSYVMNGNRSKGATLMRGGMSAMNELCRVMALSASDRCAAAALVKNSNMLNNVEEEFSEEDTLMETEKSNKKKGRISEMQLAIYFDKKFEVIETYAKSIWFTIKRYTKPDWHLPVVKEEKVMYNKEEAIAHATAAAAVITASVETKARYHLEALENLIKLLENDGNNRIEENESLELMCPLLLSVKPHINVFKRIPESPSAGSVTDRDWSHASAVQPILQSMLSFSRHDYHESCEKLTVCRLSQVLGRLGGTAAQRDIISQTLIGNMTSHDIPCHVMSCHVMMLCNILSYSLVVASILIHYLATTFSFIIPVLLARYLTESDHFSIPQFQ